MRGPKSFAVKRRGFWQELLPEVKSGIRAVRFHSGVEETMQAAMMQFIESRQMRANAPEFRTGDTVRVNWKIKEGEKERVQAFEGIVIRKTKGGARATFTVRKMSFGVGVERIFPLHSPRYETIDVLSKGSVARNRLFYLRGLRGKASKVDAQEEETAEVPAPAK